MLYSVKIVTRNNNSMLNICDPELLDKTLSDGKLVMKITKNYYHDELVDKIGYYLKNHHVPLQ